MGESGPLSHFLGIAIERDASSILISQSKYLQQILVKSRMEHFKPISTPSEIKINVEELTNAEMSEDEKYPCQNAIGSLMYAMLFTRPDLCYNPNFKLLGGTLYMQQNL